MTTKEAIANIKDRMDIADVVRRYVDLKPNGMRFSAPCPFHQETKPSFFVFPDKGTFYCFGCQASGDIFDFYSRINGLDFLETVAQLADELGIKIDSSKSGQSTLIHAAGAKKNEMIAVHGVAADYYQAALQAVQSEACRKYIKKRGIPEDIQKYFQLGYAPECWRFLADWLKKNGYSLDAAAEAGLLGKSASGALYDRFRGRLMFPIKNLGGQVIAFGGRIIEDCDQPKYINSADSPIYKKGTHLFGLFQARKEIISKGCAFLTEGYMDVLTLHQFNYRNAVGVLGTSLTKDQIKRLGGFTSRVILLFDGDAPGRKAALRACEMFLACGFACEVILLPEGEDIDSLLRNKGCDFFDVLVKKASEGFKFCLDAVSRMAPKDAIAWAKNFINDITVSELVSPFISRLAAALNLSEEELRKVHSPKSAGARLSRHGGRSGDDQQAGFTAKHEEQILIAAVRYPERVAEIRDWGAEILLTSVFAKNLWNKLLLGADSDLILHLDEEQKKFWNKHRGPTAPPLLSPEREFSSLKQLLAEHFSSNKKSVLAASYKNDGAGTNYDADIEYLRMLQQTLRADHE